MGGKPIRTEAEGMDALKAQLYDNSMRKLVDDRPNVRQNEMKR